VNPNRPVVGLSVRPSRPLPIGQPDDNRPEWSRREPGLLGEAFGKAVRTLGLAAVGLGVLWVVSWVWLAI